MKALVWRPQNGAISETHESFMSENNLLSENRGFLDEGFGNEREIVGEPGVDPAFERADPGDSFGSHQQRHTAAWSLGLRVSGSIGS